MIIVRPSLRPGHDHRHDNKDIIGDSGAGASEALHDLPLRKQCNGGSRLGESDIVIFATATEDRPEPSSGRWSIIGDSGAGRI
jgi:hypothetical protein